MKKLFILGLVLILLVSSFGSAFAAPGKNPNGYWIYDVNCEHGTFDVWVANDHTEASFDSMGGVGVMKALYMDFGSGYELIWQVPGNGVFKHTTWCEWVIEGLPPMAGKVLIP
ncbi:MAG: hypothetical protein A2W35_18145 [Chloroflexi bacterium RBG_16_57_11]|nr:MAG: hypothetical protein A2W35_18145 [Chloroflexi bacterium RBG_16_57_11]